MEEMYGWEVMNNGQFSMNFEIRRAYAGQKQDIVKMITVAPLFSEQPA
jgi:hypothetical protein